jgi:benzoyl-CoA reductase/2-hydroxyglutaryl-CoA dehydratase subunit BcrC/BadD/HgdB
MERKPIHTTKLLKKIMATYYSEFATLSKDDKVAWCSSVGPAEVLIGLGYKVYYPENHSAMIGAYRLSAEYIPLANAIGYSSEICSYLTSDIGAFLKKDTPLKKTYGIGIPRPDVIVYNTNQCRDIKEWFSFYSKKFDVPLLGVDPPKHITDLDIHIESVKIQFENLVEPLEKIIGRKLDINRLKTVVGLSLDTSRLWRCVLDTATHVPSPLTFFDSCIHMGPAVVLRGTQPAIDYYKTLKTELEQRVKDGISAVDDETVRIYWEGMPIWGKLSSLSSLFMRLRTCVVASTYCNSWIFDELDPSNPFESMAKSYTKIFINRSEDVKEKYIESMIEKFKIDGIIFHDSKTCTANSNARYGMPNRLEKKGIRSLVLNADLNDLRFYYEEQTITNIETFIEQIMM